MKIISHSNYVDIVTYHRTFSRTEDRFTGGFSFDCDKEGNVDVAKLQPCALNSWTQCLSGSVDGETLYDLGIETHTSHRRVAAVGKCECKLHVVLSNFTNTCDCGRDYNSGGQLLAAREQWGEETGEHWTECY